jgi:hypothetical protein
MVQTSTEDPTLETILYASSRLKADCVAILNASLLSQRTVGVFCDILTLDSDSDASSIGQATSNRGKKLKRRARYVHRGRLAGEYGLTLDGAVRVFLNCR